MKKRTLIKMLALALALCAVIPMCFVSCSSKGKTLISLGDHKISTNIYKLMLTQQKGSMAYSIFNKYGDYNSSKFWDMTVDYETQATNEEFYNELILERAKNYLAALALYDDLSDEKSDFKMPSVYKENIEHAINDLIEYDAGGSKTSLNAILSDYGININMLRDYLIMDAKANYVVNYLYGANGEKIGEDVKKEYFDKYYVSCKQILIQKFYYIYETDKDGDEIYYDLETGHILYDKTKTPAVDKDGNAVNDKHGNRVYYNDDGSIAYDKVKGDRKIKVDENGVEQYKVYEGSALEKLRDKAQELSEKAQDTDLNGFEILRRENSEDYDADDEAGGRMYYATNVSYAMLSSAFVDKMAATLSEMKVGEVRLVESELSYNIIIKTSLEAGAYDEEKYEGYFVDETFGVYDFTTNLKSDLYGTRLKKYSDQIVVDEKVLGSLDFSISNVLPNYYYPDPDVAYYLYTGE